MSNNEQFSFSNLALEKNLEFTAKEEEVIKSFGLSTDDFKKLLSEPAFAEGTYALIFELPNQKETLAKVWKNPDNEPQRAQHEMAALRLLRRRDQAHAPRLLDSLKSTTVIFEEKIEGAPIQEYNQEMIGKLASALATIHSIELNSYGKPFTQRKKGTKLDCLNDGITQLEQIIKSSPGKPEIIASINNAVEKIKSRATEKSASFQDNKFTLVHFDLNKNNILYSPTKDKVILIDWEQASAGDNAMDIAKLFLKQGFSKQQTETFLENYKNQLAKNDLGLDDRLEIYKPFVLINSILWRLSVLENVPAEKSSEEEEAFYSRVKNNLSKELADLHSFIQTT